MVYQNRGSVHAVECDAPVYGFCLAIIGQYTYILFRAGSLRPTAGAGQSRWLAPPLAGPAPSDPERLAGRAEQGERVGRAGPGVGVPGRPLSIEPPSCGVAVGRSDAAWLPRSAVRGTAHRPH